MWKSCLPRMTQIVAVSGLSASGALLAEEKVNSESLHEKTKKWYFYHGPMNTHEAESVRIFKCDQTPLANDIAYYLGTKVGDMKST